MCSKERFTLPLFRVLWAFWTQRACCWSEFFLSMSKCTFCDQCLGAAGQGSRGKSPPPDGSGNITGEIGVVPGTDIIGFWWKYLTSEQMYAYMVSIQPPLLLMLSLDAHRQTSGIPFSNWFLHWKSCQMLLSVWFYHFLQQQLKN